MTTKTHVLISGIAATGLYFTTDVDPISVLIFILWSGVLIDIDHLALFAIKYKIYGFRQWKILAARLQERHQAELYIFHSPEFHASMAMLCIFFPFLFWIFIAGIVHFLCDTVVYYRFHRNFQFLKRLSVSYKSIEMLKRKN